MNNNINSEKNVTELADFLMFAQRSFLLDLAADLHNCNISYAQFFLMGFLNDSESLTMSEIATKMGHSTAAATGLVDRLEKLDFVERFNDPSDRRKVKVRITEEGTEIVDRIRVKLEKSLETHVAKEEVTAEL